MKKNGFTFIELVIVVAVICGIAAIVIPELLRIKHQRDQKSPCCERYLKDLGRCQTTKCQWCTHVCHWGRCECIHSATNTRCICERPMMPVEQVKKGE